MALYVPPASSNYKPAPEGLHQAVIADVIDVGMRDREWQGKKWQQHQIRVVYELDVPPGDLLDGGKRPTHSEWLGLSLDEKANLRKRIESILGRKLKESELPSKDGPGFDVESLIGMNCMVQINHEKRVDGSTKAKAGSVTRIPPKGYDKITVQDYVRKASDAKQQAQDPNEPPPLTDDDIPF